MTTNTKFWTLEEILTKMKRELDLDEEDFTDDDELREYANDAIDEAESIIHTLNEDYFLTRKPDCDFEAGIDEYPMPEDIYATKIRKIVFYDGTVIYPVGRLGTLEKFMEYRASRSFPTYDNLSLGYFVTNITSSNPRIAFSPVPVARGKYEVWYIRNANRLEDAEDVCDIPEFVRFIFDYIRERVSYKEAAGSPKHQDSVTKLDQTRNNMRLTLQEMVIDGETELPLDMTHYEEST